MTFTYKVETNDFYRETEYGQEYDGSEVDEVTYEANRQQLKTALISIIASKFFNNDENAVTNFINELDEIEELAESFKTDLEDFFRTEALERYYE